MRAGTRSSSTCQTSLGGPTVTLPCHCLCLHGHLLTILFSCCCFHAKQSPPVRCATQHGKGDRSDWAVLTTMSFLATGTNYIETLRVQIHANCRIRRIYFSDRLYSEEELPPEFKLFLPIQK
jgi:hypothetical protein